MEERATGPVQENVPNSVQTAGTPVRIQDIVDANNAAMTGILSSIPPNVGPPLPANSQAPIPIASLKPVDITQPVSTQAEPSTQPQQWTVQAVTRNGEVVPLTIHVPLAMALQAASMTTGKSPAEILQQAQAVVAASQRQQQQQQQQHQLHQHIASLPSTQPPVSTSMQISSTQPQMSKTLRLPSPPLTPNSGILGPASSTPLTDRFLPTTPFVLNRQIIRTNAEGGRLFECTHPGCDKKFTRLQNLKSHIDVHSGNRPYPCKHCDARFRRKQDLQRHNRTMHGATKLHSCPNCHKQFARADALKRHMKSKSRIYACPGLPADLDLEAPMSPSQPHQSKSEDTTLNVDSTQDAQQPHVQLSQTSSSSAAQSNSTQVISADQPSVPPEFAAPQPSSTMGHVAALYQLQQAATNMLPTSLAAAPSFGANQTGFLQQSGSGTDLLAGTLGSQIHIAAINQQPASGTDLLAGKLAALAQIATSQQETKGIALLTGAVANQAPIASVNKQENGTDALAGTVASHAQMVSVSQLPTNGISLLATAAASQAGIASTKQQVVSSMDMQLISAQSGASHPQPVPMEMVTTQQQTKIEARPTIAPMQPTAVPAMSVQQQMGTAQLQNVISLDLEQSISAQPEHQLIPTLPVSLPALPTQHASAQDGISQPLSLQTTPSQHQAIAPMDIPQMNFQDVLFPTERHTVTQPLQTQQGTLGQQQAILTMSMQTPTSMHPPTDEQPTMPIQQQFTASYAMREPVAVDGIEVQRSILPAVPQPLEMQQMQTMPAQQLNSSASRLQFPAQLPSTQQPSQQTPFSVGLESLSAASHAEAFRNAMLQTTSQQPQATQAAVQQIQIPSADPMGAVTSGAALSHRNAGMLDAAGISCLDVPIPAVQLDTPQIPQHQRNAPVISLDGQEQRSTRVQYGMTVAATLADNNQQQSIAAPATLELQANENGMPPFVVEQRQALPLYHDRQHNSMIPAMLINRPQLVTQASQKDVATIGHQPLGQTQMQPDVPQRSESMSGVIMATPQPMPVQEAISVAEFQQQQQIMQRRASYVAQNLRLPVKENGIRGVGSGGSRHQPQAQVSQQQQQAVPLLMSPEDHLQQHEVRPVQSILGNVEGWPTQGESQQNLISNIIGTGQP